MHALVTGGAGFIGSHLCDRLVKLGFKVTAIDNFCLGRRRNIEHLFVNKYFNFHEIDMLNYSALESLCSRSNIDTVFHLAANSDIAAGNSDPQLDLRLNQLTTLHILDIMKRCEIKQLFFSSTSAIFGEAAGNLYEDFGPLKPISFYGASKLAAESYISVYSHTFDIQAVILRFPNVVGERATHGAIYDFINKLKSDPFKLNVLGNGEQTKPYLYVSDLIDAILTAWDNTTEKFMVYHASGIGQTRVRDIAEMVVARLSPAAIIHYGSGDRGWAGDVPRFSYDISRLKSLGWSPRRTSDEAVALAIDSIISNGF